MRAFFFDLTLIVIVSTGLGVLSVYGPALLIK